MNPIKRTKEEHLELIERVAKMRAAGMTFTGIAETLGDQYNVGIKDVQNVYYRHVRPATGAPDHQNHVDESVDLRAAAAASDEMEAEAEEVFANPVKRELMMGEPDTPDKAVCKEETPSIPEILFQYSSRTHHAKLRCEHPGLKIAIDVSDPKSLQAVLADLVQMLEMASKEV